MLIHDKFVFIHLQKTAGTFLADALRRELPAGSLTRGAKGKLHPGWDDIPVDVSDRPVLGYVRNPWDWYVSWYHFVKTHGAGGVPYRILLGNGKNDFAMSVRNACSGMVESWGIDGIRFIGRGDDFYTTCFRLFFGAGLDSERLTIGRYESLIDDLELFLSRVDVSLDASATTRIRQGERLKASEHRPYREYYDDDLRDLVGESCRSLVERFGYRF